MSDSMRRAFNLGAATELGNMACWSRANYCARTLNIFLAYSGFFIAWPLFILVLRAFRVPAAKRLVVSDEATRFWMIICMFAYPPLNNFLMNTLLCRGFGDGVNVLAADHSIACASEPQCIGTATVFIPVFTIGFPLTLVLWMHKAFSESGRKKLRADAADDAAFEAEIARYKARFGFFALKYEVWYCERLRAVASPLHSKAD